MMTSSPSIESLSAAAGGATLAFDGTEGRMEKEAPIADAADRRIASFSSRSVLTDSSPTCVGGLFHGQQSTRVPESNEVRIVVTTVDDDASPGDGGCAAFGGLFGKCYEKADVNVDQEGASKDSEEPAEVEGSDIVDQDSNHEVDLSEHLVLMRKSKSSKKKSKKTNTRPTTKFQLPKVNLNSQKFDLIKSVLSADDNRGGKAMAAIFRSKSDTAIDAGFEGSKESIAGDVVTRSTKESDDLSVVTEMVADRVLVDTDQFVQAVPPIDSDREEKDSDGKGKKVEPDGDHQPKHDGPEREQDVVGEGLEWSEPIEEQSQLPIEQNENPPSSIGDTKIDQEESKESSPIVVDDKIKIVVADEMMDEPDAKKNEPLPEVAAKVTETPTKSVDVGDAASSAAASTKQGESFISLFRPPTNSKENAASLETDAKAGKEDDSKPVYEYRQTKVTLRFKALAGLSVSRKKGKLGKGTDVKVVVTYKQNTTSSDSFTSLNIPSLPVLLAKDDQKNARVFARWPGNERDDVSVSSTDKLVSSLVLSRSVRRAPQTTPKANGSKKDEGHYVNYKVNEKEAFLASLSEAFAPELLDLEIGLMQGANEIIPLGTSTVIIPADQRNVELDIPIVRLPASSRKKIESMISRRHSSQAVSFSSDKGAKYTLNDGAFLRLQLSVEPGKVSPPSLPPTGALDKSSTRPPRGREFRSGPINKALKSRRKVVRLMESKKLSLSQRVQLYMELRNGKKATSKPGLQSAEVLLDTPSDVSTVTHDFLFEGNNPRPCKSVPDDASGSLGLEMYKIEEEPSNSLITTDSSKAAPSVGNHNEVNVSIKDTIYQSSQSLSVPVQAIELSENDTSAMMEDLSHVSRKNGSVNSRSLADFLDHPPPSPQKGQNEGANEGCTIFASDAATYFSSSIQSILSNNHPQQSLKQKMLRILSCDTEYCADALESKLEGCGVLEKACRDDETLTFVTYDDATFESLVDERK